LVSGGWSLSALPPKADIRQRIEHMSALSILVPRDSLIQLKASQD
jgi:hypothetical protein